MDLVVLLVDILLVLALELQEFLLGLEYLFLFYAFRFELGLFKYLVFLAFQDDLADSGVADQCDHRPCYCCNDIV